MSRNTFLRDSSIFVAAQDADAVASILADTGYIQENDEKGNIIRMDFDCCDMREDEGLYKALAPFMRDGSFLEFNDDLGNVWRWVFHGGDCSSVYAIVLWPKPGMPGNIKQDILTAFGPNLMEE